MTNYRKTMAEALIEVFAEELSPDEIAKEQSKAIDQFNDDMAKEFPKEKFTARANVSPLGGGIAFEFGVIPAKDAKGVDLLNAPAHSKFMMHLTDNKNRAVPMSKFSVEHIMGRLPVKFRKVTGKSPTDAVKKLVDWFKKNKRDFEGLVVEELDLDEGKKETWMKKAQDAVKKAGGNTGKMDWDSATYLYNTGKSPEEAGEQLAKLQKEEVELGEATGKEIAAKMMKDKSMKAFASKVAKMKTVSRDDLEKMLPDYVAGAAITKLFEEVELDEALKKGAKVEVPHKGKRTQGTVVRYVPQRGAASPYYVVYVGEYESIEVPAHKIKEEVELDEANYEIKNGKVHISKKEFAKVSKDYKGKDTMTVLDPKTGATVNMPVVFEEVDLDEAFPANPAQKAWAGAYKRGAPKGKFQVKTSSSKKGKITVTDFDSLDDAKKHLAAMEKKGQRGIISQDGKLVKEEVELDEGKSERDILIALKKEKLGGYFSGGTLYVAQRVLETVRDLLKDMKLKSMPKLVGEEVKKEARQLKDPKKEVMVVKGGKVIVINKKDAKEYLNKGWKLAEEVEPTLDFEIKTDKGGNEVVYMKKKDYLNSPSDSRSIDKDGDPTLSVAKADNEDEFEDLPVKFVDESSRSDALKAMRGDPVLGKRDKKELETDIAATADDKKAASKNIIYQLMQVLALKGSGELRLTPSKKKEKGDYSKTKGSAYVEFSSGKKEKVDRKIAREILSKYVSLQKPIDKQKFQAKIAKSYKDMLKALKESFKEDVELDEGRMSQLHAYIKDGKDAKWIAKKMGIDVKTVQSFIDDFDESLGEHKNKILNRIGQKIREKKNG